MAVVPGVGGAAETQVTRPQVHTGATVKTWSPQTLVHVLTVPSHQPPPRPAAEGVREKLRIEEVRVSCSDTSESFSLL